MSLGSVPCKVFFKNPVGIYAVRCILPKFHWEFAVKSIFQKFLSIYVCRSGLCRRGMIRITLLIKAILMTINMCHMIYSFFIILGKMNCTNNKSCYFQVITIFYMSMHFILGNSRLVCFLSE